MIFHVSGARLSAVALALMLTILPTVARAADCGHDGHGFDAWIAQFKQRAAAQGISPAVLAAALAGISYDWLSGNWRQSEDLSVNYMLAATRR